MPRLQRWQGAPDTRSTASTLARATSPHLYARGPHFCRRAVLTTACCDVLKCSCRWRPRGGIWHPSCQSSGRTAHLALTQRTAGMPSRLLLCAQRSRPWWPTTALHRLRSSVLDLCCCLPQEATLPSLAVHLPGCAATL
eukprot:365203-Chlamydomonas_euryale.AAC.7